MLHYWAERRLGSGKPGRTSLWFPSCKAGICMGRSSLEDFWRENRAYEKHLRRSQRSGCHLLWVAPRLCMVSWCVCAKAGYADSWERAQVYLFLLEHGVSSCS